MKVDVLGTEYEIVIVNKDVLGEITDGDCDFYTKQIRILSISELLEGCNNISSKHKRFNQVLKHELCHAFLFESGLTDYAYDETLVDWFSLQFDKMEFAINSALGNFEL